MSPQKTQPETEEVEVDIHPRPTKFPRGIYTMPFGWPLDDDFMPPISIIDLIYRDVNRAVSSTVEPIFEPLIAELSEEKSLLAAEQNSLWDEARERSRKARDKLKRKLQEVAGRAKDEETYAHALCTHSEASKLRREYENGRFLDVFSKMESRVVPDFIQRAKNLRGLSFEFERDEYAIGSSPMKDIRRWILVVNRMIEISDKMNEIEKHVRHCVDYRQFRDGVMDAFTRHFLGEAGFACLKKKAEELAHEKAEIAAAFAKKRVAKKATPKKPG